MASRMVCVYPTYQIEIAQENLSLLAGYVEGMCSNDLIPERHQGQVKEFIENARQAVMVYDLELRSDDDD